MYNSQIRVYISQRHKLYILMVGSKIVKRVNDRNPQMVSEFSGLPLPRPRQFTPSPLSITGIFISFI
jgi:hypothetical protein